MMPTKNLISELQDHFTERGRLVNAKTAIKCYTQDASFFFSYKDGWGNKKYINLPFTPEDVMPILQKYIDGIEKDIIYSSIEVEVDSEDDLAESVKECQYWNPKTFLNIESIKSELKKIYAHRMIVENKAEDNIGDDNYRQEPYHIPISSDSVNGFYEFWLVGRCKNTLMFGFNGIEKRKQQA